jgi:stearoyl-CoA desaturase (Delta-9 desaturase)
VLVHLACFAAIWTGVTWQALAICVALYFVRMFGATAGYHRYFSHRTYKTSRVGQFLLAVLAQSTAQRGVIWWSAKHRQHHLHSDTELDVHSPKHHGFLYSHVGWIFKRNQDEVDLDTVKDLTRYPELVWLNKHYYLVPALLALVCLAVAGWPGLVVGFFWSTTILFHGTFMINSLAHVHGKQRYVTGDDSRNNWWLALITLGEGWHNNHHAYQSSVRQGFRWWEYDPTFYALRFLSWFGIVWDLHSAPASVVRGEQRLGIHRVHVVDAVEVGRLDAVRPQRPDDDVEEDRPGNRFNDCKCDPAGRLWAGTMSVGEESPGTGLRRLRLLRDEDPPEGWQEFNNGWTGGSCHGLAFTGNRVVAATHRSGVLSMALSGDWNMWSEVREASVGRCWPPMFSAWKKGANVSYVGCVNCFPSMLSERSLTTVATWSHPASPRFCTRSISMRSDGSYAVSFSVFILLPTTCTSFLRFSSLYTWS